MTKWHWITAKIARAIHDEQIAEHGGAAGLRDEGLLESALARPMNLAAYGRCDVHALAAAYAVAIARNHPFVDGNKRTAFVAMELFLHSHGWAPIASDADCVGTMLAVAAGELDDAGLARWLRKNSRKQP